VQRVGEVERHGAPGQADQLALRREDEHLVEEHLELGVLDQLLGVAAVLQHLDEVAQVDQRVDAAGGHLMLGVEAVGLVLVAPVGGHALLATRSMASVRICISMRMPLGRQPWCAASGSCCAWAWR
jgi:hypothetical protein